MSEPDVAIIIFLKILSALMFQDSSLKVDDWLFGSLTKISFANSKALFTSSFDEANFTTVSLWAEFFKFTCAHLEVKWYGENTF